MTAIHTEHGHRSSAGRSHDVAPARQRVTFDGIAEAIVYALLAFTPLAFGGVDPGPQEVFLLLAGAAAAVVAAKHVAAAGRGRGPAYRWTWAYVPIAMFLALAAAQAVALPAA